MIPLINRAWEIFHAKKDIGFIVKPSIPILFFGDVNAYFRSEQRVITVGLNPSHHEFPKKNPFKRFRGAESTDPEILHGKSYSRYIEILSDYFKEKPYSWFKCYDEIIRDAGVSYYADKANTALHTDLYSPLATKPTWSGLKDAQKEVLGTEGIILWHELVKVLEPDIIIASLGEKHLPKIAFHKITHKTDSFSVEGRFYSMEFSEVKIGKEKTARLITGLASRRPFMRCKVEHRQELRGFIKDRMRKLK